MSPLGAHIRLPHRLFWARRASALPLLIFYDMAVILIGGVRDVDLVKL